MKYEARRFDQDAYDKYDAISKEKVIDFLLKRGHTVAHKEEDYNHDLVTLKDGVEWCFELEVKIGYPFTCRYDYPFRTVSFLGRKKRLHELKEFYYMIICKETDSVVFCHSNNIFRPEYVEQVTVKSKNRKGGDEMYRVPVGKCGFFNLIHY